MPRSPATSSDIMHTSIVRNAETIYNESPSLACLSNEGSHAYSVDSTSSTTEGPSHLCIPASNSRKRIYQNALARSMQSEGYCRHHRR
nr:hypothetical protein [Tanacetum cinerariifolium]